MTTTRLTLKLQDDIGVDRIAKGLLERDKKRRCLHVENARPIDDLEYVRRHQGFELFGGERWIAVEQRIEFKEAPEHPIRDPHDRGARSGNIASRAHEVDVIDLFPAGNVVGGIVRPMDDAGHDDVAKITRIQRLPQKTTTSGNRK